MAYSDLRMMTIHPSDTRVMHLTPALRRYLEAVRDDDHDAAARAETPVRNRAKRLGLVRFPDIGECDPRCYRLLTDFGRCVLGAQKPEKV